MTLSSPGGIRTHSIYGSKPKWSANCLPGQFITQHPEQESNLQTPGLEPDRSASLRIWVSRDGSSPGGTRTPDPLFVREPPSPLGYRTVDRRNLSTMRIAESSVTRAIVVRRTLTHDKPRITSPNSAAEAVRLELTSDKRRHLFSRQAPHPAG